MNSAKIHQMVMAAGKYASEHTREHPGQFEGVFLGEYTELILKECLLALPGSEYESARKRIAEHFIVDNEPTVS